GHGRPGDDRVEEPGHGQRDGGGVVPEGPAEVLEDGAERSPGEADGGGHAVELGREQGDVGALDGDVGAGADGDAEVGLDEGRGVVDAVAHHGHDPALLLKVADGGHLVGGEHLGEDVADADGGGDGVGGGPVVAGDHDDVDAHRGQVGDSGGGVVLEGVGHRQDAADLPIPAGEDGGL